MVTFRQLTLQCCHHSLIQLHSPPLQFIQDQAPIHRPSHQLYAHCHHPWKSLSPMLQRINMSLNSHHISTDLNVKTMQKEVIEFSPYIRRKLVLKLVSVWLCFPRQRQKSSWNEAPVSQAVWAQMRGMRAPFYDTECVKLNRFASCDFSSFASS